MEITNKKFKESIVVRLNGKTNVGDDVRIIIEHLNVDRYNKSFLDVVVNLEDSKKIYYLLGECIKEGEIRSKMKDTYEDEND